MVDLHHPDPGGEVRLQTYTIAARLKPGSDRRQFWTILVPAHLKVTLY